LCYLLTTDHKLLKEEMLVDMQAGFPNF